jgi:non-homologous end joining protein Ku
MGGKEKTDGEASLIQIRLKPEEMRIFDALKTVLERDSRVGLARFYIREKMRQAMADPEIRALVEAELKSQAPA